MLHIAEEPMFYHYQPLIILEKSHSYHRTNLLKFDKSEDVTAMCVHIHAGIETRKVHKSVFNPN